jgi:hypothetical protein
MAMNTRILVAVSLGLNFILGVALAWHVTKTPGSVIMPEEPVSEAVVNPRTRQEPVTRMTLAAPVAHTTNFHWSRVESPDFQQYMTNLRAIGCPEETIRDLIVAEVNKLYAPRFAALTGQMRSYAYWKPAGKKNLEPLRSQLEALQQEKRDLLQTLLGIDRDPNEKWANLSVQEVAEMGRYAFLPADKEQQVRAIMEKYKSLEEGQRSSDLIGTPDSGKKLREQRRQELAQALTPEELHEFDLRDSNTADSVRNRFGAADLTEEEYRKLFALRKAYEDEQGAVPDYSDPEKIRRRGEARRQLDEAYKETLGEQRHAEIQKQQDPTWRGLTSAAQQYNLPQTTVDQAYQYQQLASQQVAALMSDPAVSSENRRAAMKLIQDEVERQLTGLIGADAYSQFRKTSPRFYYSGGGDTMVSSGPVPIGAPLLEGVQQRVITTVGDGGRSDTSITVKPR